MLAFPPRSGSVCFWWRTATFREIAMTVVRFILALAILVFAAYIVAMNWGCVIVSMRNKRRGIDRHPSTVPVVSFLLAGVAYAIYPRAEKMWIFLVPLLDVTNWSLLWLPVVLTRKSRTKRTTEPGADGRQPVLSEPSKTSGAGGSGH